MLAVLGVQILQCLEHLVYRGLFFRHINSIQAQLRIWPGSTVHVQHPGVVVLVDQYVVSVDVSPKEVSAVKMLTISLT